MYMPTEAVAANTIKTVTVKKIIIKPLALGEELKITDESDNILVRGLAIAEVSFEFPEPKVFTFKCNVDAEVTYE